MKVYFSALFIILISVCCKSNNSVKQQVKNKDKSEFIPQYIPGPQVLVYKTKNNYNNLVPVLLSEDKSEIVSYPDPGDLLIGNTYSFPTVLNNGYLLDNRGIGKNVAFLKLTYQEYSKLQSLSLEELYGYILDKDPLVELCDCGNKTAFTSVEEQLNELIDNNKLRMICKSINQ